MSKFGGTRDGFVKMLEEEIIRAESQRGTNTERDWDSYIEYLNGLMLEADLLMEFEEDEYGQDKTMQ